jgi:hypothetical protein
MKGYFFALPRLCIRLRGGNARRAEWSGGEVYSFGVLVFAMGCVCMGRALSPFVRQTIWAWPFFIVLPLLVWIACQLLYSLNWLLANLLRRLGLYSARTNNPLQHFVIMTLMTLLAVWLMRDSHLLLRSLGIFWCALVGLNLFALGMLRIVHEP